MAYDAAAASRSAWKRIYSTKSETITRSRPHKNELGDKVRCYICKHPQLLPLHSTCYSRMGQ